LNAPVSNSSKKNNKNRTVSGKYDSPPVTFSRRRRQNGLLVGEVTSSVLVGRQRTRVGLWSPTA
jgi:hypothetical protein